MEPQQNSRNVLTIPIAIVIAGALIAGAVFLSNTNTVPSENQNIANGDGNVATQANESKMIIRPISSDDHVLGNPKAPLAIVEYSDTECPFCKSFHATMQRVADTYGKAGKVLWVYRHFPLDQLHPQAPLQAAATECAWELGGNDGFWAYVNKIFEITPSNNGLDEAELPKIAKEQDLDLSKFNACLSSEKYADKVKKDYNEAVGAGGRGTPFSIFVSSKVLSDQTISTIRNLALNLPPDTLVFSTDKRRLALSGALPYSFLERVIDAILAN